MFFCNVFAVPPEYRISVDRNEQYIFHYVLYKKTYFFMSAIPSLLGYAVAQLVEAKSRKISDSIPDGVIEIFH